MQNMDTQDIHSLLEKSIIHRYHYSISHTQVLSSNAALLLLNCYMITAEEVLIFGKYDIIICYTSNDSQSYEVISTQESFCEKVNLRTAHPQIPNQNSLTVNCTSPPSCKVLSTHFNEKESQDSHSNSPIEIMIETKIAIEFQASPYVSSEPNHNSHSADNSHLAQSMIKKSSGRYVPPEEPGHSPLKVTNDIANINHIPELTVPPRLDMDSHIQNKRTDIPFMMSNKSRYINNQPPASSEQKGAFEDRASAENKIHHSAPPSSPFGFG